MYINKTLSFYITDMLNNGNEIGSVKTADARVPITNFYWRMTS